MDLNHEPTDYESVALTKLSYAPTDGAYYSIVFLPFASTNILNIQGFYIEPVSTMQKH